jgi:glycosyltransferase involved in cell wall biosynthesis
MVRNPGISEKKKIVFAFDRVMHYHKDTIAALERGMEAHGYEFFLLSSQDKPGAKGRVALAGKVAKKHEYFRLTEKMVGTFSVRYQHGLVPAIEKIRPDTVVSLCHSGTVSEWRLLSLKKRLGFRLIAWQCGYEFNPGRLKKFILGRFVPRFDHHLAYHTNAKHYAIAHGARPDQVTVMHNTINEAAIVCGPRDEARKLVSERWPAVAGKKVILYVGAILEEKRLEVVFDALDILKREDVVFLLVGDGPHLNEIRRKYGHRRDFVSTGQIVDGVGPYFDAADVFVLPGTGGLAINEAMAHGVAVVSGYADGSADDLVIDGKNGFRLRDGGPEEIAMRLGDVLSDATVAATMGEAGRQMIQGELSFKRFIARVVGVLAGAGD